MFPFAVVYPPLYGYCTLFYIAMADSQKNVPPEHKKYRQFCMKTGLPDFYFIFNYLPNSRSRKPAATAEPITPATFGPLRA